MSEFFKLHQAAAGSNQARIICVPARVITAIVPDMSTGGTVVHTNVLMDPDAGRFIKYHVTESMDDMLTLVDAVELES